MKFIKWKALVITCLVCLIPILLGLALWNSLPNEIAIHFDMNGIPDNFASKGFTVFGLPLMMVALQVFCCFINDINAYKYGERKKLEAVTKWIIPIMCLILQPVTFGYALGLDLDIRRIVAIIVGLILIVIGNYLPKYGVINVNEEKTEKTRKISRFIGIETVIMGALFIFSIFFRPVVTVICLFLLIPYVIISIFYSVYNLRH